MRNELACIHCGSESVEEFQPSAMIYRCNDCGEYFEDDDELILEDIKKKYKVRQKEKMMRDS